MHSEKQISHHPADWMMRASLAAGFSSLLVMGLQLDQMHHGNQPVAAEAGNGSVATPEDQSEKGIDVAGGIALISLVTFTAGGSWRLVQRPQAGPLEVAQVPYPAEDICLS